MSVGVVLGSGWPAPDADVTLVPRVHLYEHPDPQAVAASIRRAIVDGVTTLILTNACGATNPELEVGEICCITDHLNLTGRTPLVGREFVDMSHPYSERVRALLPDLRGVVYAQVPGPQYETPAEVRMLRAMGADVVGMSTVLECIAARAEGCEVLGLSLVTDMAGDPVTHAEVLGVGVSHAERLRDVLNRVVARL